MSDEKEAAPVKKKGGAKKWILIGTGLIVLVGGGVGGGLYASNAGLFGGAKAEGKEGEGGESKGMKPPAGEGGDKYASTYYQLEKEFTSNLRESVHFVQVGIAISTPYDNTVIEGLKTHEMAVRSAILLALGETSEEEVFTAEGKKKLQKLLADAINAVLKEKEGFGGVGNVYFTNFIVQ